MRLCKLLTSGILVVSSISALGLDLAALDGDIVEDGVFDVAIDFHEIKLVGTDGSGEFEMENRHFVLEGDVLEFSQMGALQRRSVEVG